MVTQKVVTPVKTGVQEHCNCLISLDSGFRRNDENVRIPTFCMIVSIGIATYPADGDTADVLFKKADTAMYKAKGTEKRVVLFRESGERTAG